MPNYRIDVDSRLQRLYLWEVHPGGGMLIREYPVSTAKNGMGERTGSFCTPRGPHRVAEKFGDGLPLYAVFRARQPTGEIWSPALDRAYPDADWILTRVLWLEGLEPGKNRGGEVDSHDRYIYIHGTSEEHLIGQPSSHGCIRMRNTDVAELFDLVQVGTPIEINGP